MRVEIDPVRAEGREENTYPCHPQQPKEKQ